jgi:hypothetical protein
VCDNSVTLAHTGVTFASHLRHTMVEQASLKSPIDEKVSIIECPSLSRRVRAKIQRGAASLFRRRWLTTVWRRRRCRRRRSTKTRIDSASHERSGVDVLAFF